MGMEQPTRVPYDLSTLNLPAVRKLPVYELPPGYHLQTDPGNGCFLDPPGFPTYFTRSLYNKRGDSPERGPQQVITLDGTHYVTQSATDWHGGSWEDSRQRYDDRMMRLWIALPVEHVRVQAWMVAVHHHLRHCYIDDAQTAEPFEYGRPATVIFPVPNYKLRAFRDDPRFSEEWRTSERAAIDAHNASVRERYAQVATVDNHSAVRLIRRFYAGYQPDFERAEAAPRPGDWWERHASRPAASACVPPGWFGAHRPTGWCQFCGHDSKEEEAA
jgi:hypothetical protein